MSEPSHRAADTGSRPAPETSAAGRLTLVGTPIGNLDDASAHMRAAIESADVIAAEDTRRFLGLAERLGLRHTREITSLFDHNEQAKAESLIDEVAAGRHVVLLTDAGMPAVSDPGYRVVAAAYARGVTVTTASGPSAVITALALSGLPSDRFAFEGFLPRKAGERRRKLGALAADERTLVCFESPHRLVDALADLEAACGPERQIAVCRELTKTYEEVIRGTIAEVRARVGDGVRGEITLVISGASPEAADAGDYVGEMRRLVDAGMRVKDAAGEVATRHGVSKRQAYETYLQAER
ncbi:16S rRNA (cytidine(1402)-2'-O)-methyltransferase [Brevibacterium luteolum]|uniref:Ribosomal RNA small subunit methyltransferase I n=1 Tax=Brevibacterium luteolum TaxID=199591 RepID=A0A2N6PH93_9MICO|nr:16S rRNA (cytidine(1402)-2'-O)-methyltransferase [Brevibacterium luteolum]PMB98062.1 16S rRNA (cytidine(1402)-2'-O)-methyltransferase [Brevibacterium luteolum]